MRSHIHNPHQRLWGQCGVEDEAAGAGLAQRRLWGRGLSVASRFARVDDPLIKELGHCHLCPFPLWYVPTPRL